ncbi:unnamed protein product [Rhizophagus irregularis]|nr:unnamed protein product [Rhizophagus irregularis]
MDLFKLCELYCLSDDSNPSIDSFFSCGCVDNKNEKYKEALCKLLGESLQQLSSMYPMKLQKNLFIISPQQLSRLKPIKIPEKLIEGKTGTKFLTMGENDWLD